MKNPEIASINHFVVPDAEVMRRAKDQLNSSASAESFGFLTSTKDKLKSVSNDLNDAHQQLFDNIKKVSASLSNAGLKLAIMGMNETSQNTALPIPQKNDTLARLLERGVKRVCDSQVALVAANRHLKNLAGEFESIKFAGSVDSLRRVHTDEVAVIEQRIESDKADCERLKEEKLFIEDAVQKFKAPNWRTFFKGLLPTAGEIEAAMKLVATGKPDTEFLQLVLSKLEGNIEGIDQGRQFSNLAQARDAVRDRISALNTSIKQDELQIHDLRRKLAAMDELDGMDSVILSWLEQVAKLAEAYTYFLRINDPGTIADVVGLQAIADRYDVFLDYLKSIKKS